MLHAYTVTVAVRREAVSERLREKLELDRRALQVVHRLLEDNVSEDFLLDCVWRIQNFFRSAKMWNVFLQVNIMRNKLLLHVEEEML